MAIEDAIVLAETLAREEPLPILLNAFMQRRFERVRTACEISLAICKLEQAEEPDVGQIYALTKKGYTLLGENF
jgi:2-polyprenyl-6-methoxyphenol hydroxylase-like FAD-dependent oxidoreductase